MKNSIDSGEEQVGLGPINSSFDLRNSIFDAKSQLETKTEH